VAKLFSADSLNILAIFPAWHGVALPLLNSPNVRKQRLTEKWIPVDSAPLFTKKNEPEQKTTSTHETIL
jgi:hypothetical protein